MLIDGVAHRSSDPNLGNAPISIASIAVKVKDQTLLRDFSLDVMHGEAIAIVGHSGVGKTTLLRVLAGLHTPASGSVTIFGRDPATLIGKGAVQYLHQVPTPWRHLNVENNLRLALKLLRLKYKKSDVEGLLHTVGLTGEERKYPFQLSQGAQARLCLARMFISEPKLIFADEPFASLDPIRREELNQNFKQLRDSAQSTIVVVTHDIIEAIRFTNRIVVLPGGGACPQCVDVGHIQSNIDPNSLSPLHLALRDRVLSLMDNGQRV